METIEYKDAKDFTNRVQLRGNLTKDPKVQPLGDTNIVKLSIAVSNDGKDDAGNKIERDPLYVDVDYWGQDGAEVAQFLREGSPVAIEGTICQQHWEDKQTGAKRSKEVVESSSIREVIFTGEKAKAPSGFPTTVTFEDLRKQEFSSNAVWLVGNLTKDAEFRVTPTGKGVASFSIGQNRQVGQREVASFFEISSWDSETSKAEDVAKSLARGEQAAVRGKLVLDKWEKDGKPRSKIKVTAFDVAKIAKSERREQGQGQAQGRQQMPPLPERSAGTGAQSRGRG